MTIDDTRRNTLKRLFIGMVAWLGLTGSRGALSQMSESELSKARERMRHARGEETKDVERLYSTKTVRVRMGGREYAIPVNYLTPKGKTYEDTLDYRYLPFFLFLPEYEGFTKENWQDPFDRRRIEVVDLSPVDKNVMVPKSEGGL